MGRHKLQSNERRYHRIAVRFTYQDVEDLKARKHEAHALAEHIRCAALKRPRPEPVPEVDRILVKVLREHGQRLNVEARAAHRGQNVTLTRGELTDIRSLLLRFLRDLTGDR